MFSAFLAGGGVLKLRPMMGPYAATYVTHA